MNGINVEKCLIVFDGGSMKRWLRGDMHGVMEWGHDPHESSWTADASHIVTLLFPTCSVGETGEFQHMICFSNIFDKGALIVCVLILQTGKRTSEIARIHVCRPWSVWVRLILSSLFSGDPSATLIVVSAFPPVVQLHSRAFLLVLFLHCRRPTSVLEVQFCEYLPGHWNSTLSRPSGAEHPIAI